MADINFAKHQTCPEPDQMKALIWYNNLKRIHYIFYILS